MLIYLFNFIFIYINNKFTYIYHLIFTLNSSYSFPKKSVYTSDIFEEVPEFIYSLTNLKNL